MTITNEVLESYLNCKLKGCLKLAGESDSKSDYETMINATRQASREEAIAKLSVRLGKGDSYRGITINNDVLKQGTSVLTDVVLEDVAVSFRFDILKRADGASNLGNHHYLPVIYNNCTKPGQRQKLLLAVLGICLGDVQGLRPTNGFVVCGREGHVGRVVLDSKLYRRATQILDDLKHAQDGGKPARLILNSHCQCANSARDAARKRRRLTISASSAALVRISYACTTARASSP